MNRILSILETIYGEDANYILEQISLHLNIKTLDHVKERPRGDWHKFMNLYCVYPDGIHCEHKLLPLQNLTRHLARIKSLGCNTVHILPFLDSPMIDHGFDISDYYRVRRDLGSIADLQELINEAKRLELDLVMDMVLNHISDQHPWFQKAEAGDERYRKFFIYTKEQPKFIRKYVKDKAVWAEYEAEGKLYTANIIFPEHTGPIPHWREGKDGYWYYHTFYPQQLDLNWFNPELFLELAKLLVYWTQYGFSFRFDAIHFIGQGPYKAYNDENTNAHSLLAVLKWIVHQVNPNALFIVEASEPVDQIVPYFGTDRHAQADMAYNFYVCNELWAAIVEHNASYVWRGLERSRNIPSHGEWLYFLRNHDELSLAYLDDDQLERINSSIAKHGVDFREGCGISGRTFSFLSGNDERFLMAYFLLISLPGAVMIPYGDEIAKKSIPLNELAPKLRKDTRNVNRGSIEEKEYLDAHNKGIFEKMSEMLHHRQLLQEYTYIWPSQIEAPDGIFAACYSNKDSKLGIFINLTHKQKTIKRDTSFSNVVGWVNSFVYNDEEIVLGPYGGVWLK